MNEFLALVDKIYPLYLLVMLGFFVGKYLKISRHKVSYLLIFILTPIVVFDSAINKTTDLYLLLPLVFFITSSTLAVIFYYFGGKIWDSNERNLLAYVSGTGNFGYFGIPLALALFGNFGVMIAVFSGLGMTLYHNTVGYYIVAKGHTTAKKALYQILKLPILYAFFLGLILNWLNLNNDSFMSIFDVTKHVYSILGMMLLGMSFATAKRTSFDKLFTILVFASKFLIYPLIIVTVVFVDKVWLNLFDQDVHRIMMVLSVTPLATNAVTYATYLKIHPEKAAFTVLLSTLFALIYIPLFIALFLT